MNSATIERLEELWSGPLPETERLTFMRLNAERRQTAIQRLEGVTAYLKGILTTAEAMRRLDLGRSQFYKLVRDWKVVQSLESLVPHAKPSKPRATRLAPQIADLVRQIIVEHADTDRLDSETTLVRCVQTRAVEQGLPRPADISVRRMIARLTLADPGLSLSHVSRGQRGAISAKHGPLKEDNVDLEPFAQVFGGRLLLDHSTLDLLVDNDETVFRPTVSLVVDDATRLILAHQLTDRIPAPDDFINVMARAAAGYHKLQRKGISAVPGLHPVLTMRNGLSAEWQLLRSTATKARFKFDIRRAPQPVFGHILRRSMITKIGDLQLLPRSTMLSPPERVRSNDVKKAVVPWADAVAALDRAVDDHNRTRLLTVPDHVLAGTARAENLRLNTERRDWLAYGLSVFREEWATR